MSCWLRQRRVLLQFRPCDHWWLHQVSVFVGDPLSTSSCSCFLELHGFPGSRAVLCYLALTLITITFLIDLRIILGPLTTNRKLRQARRAFGRPSSNLNLKVSCLINRLYLWCSCFNLQGFELKPATNIHGLERVPLLKLVLVAQSTFNRLSGVHHG